MPDKGPKIPATPLLSKPQTEIRNFLVGFKIIIVFYNKNNFLN